MRFVQLAQKSSRRGSLRNRVNETEELERRGRGGLSDGRAAKGNRRYENKGGGANDRIRRGVTGPHRAIVLSWHTRSIAIALVLLEIAPLAVVHRTISRVAAGGQIGGGKRLCQGRDTRQKQRQKGRDGCEFAYALNQFGMTSCPKYTSEA